MVKNDPFKPNVITVSSLLIIHMNLRQFYQRNKAQLAKKRVIKTVEMGQ